ncbi:MAG: PH domain-containing protein [Bdellovibrionales bacterium]
MASYLESLLMRDEEVVYAAKLHWVTYLPSLLLLAISWTLAHYGPASLLYRYTGIAIQQPALLEIINYIVFGATVISVLMLFEAYLRIARTELAVTNRRVLAKFGIVSRTTFELFLSKVEGANVEQGIIGRMLGYGSIHVKGTGTGMTPIDRISHPEFFQRVLLEQIRRRHDSELGDERGIHD